MLSIGAFSQLSKVTTKTLRYYDDIGLLKPGYVNEENGYRYYDVGQLQDILLINKLKLYCCSLEEIAAALHRSDDAAFMASLLKQKQRDIAEKMAHYEVALDQLKRDVSNVERGMQIMAYLKDIIVDLKETQAKRVVFIRDKMNVEDYGQYMSRLLESVARNKLTVLGPPMSVFHDEEFNPASYDMEIAIPVQEAAGGTRVFAGGLCAVSTLRGAYTGLPSVYAKIKQWMEDEGYELAAPPYEVYVTDPSKVAAEENVTDVYCPVKKR